MRKRLTALLLCLMLALPFAAQAGGLSLEEVNDFLNSSSKLGEGSTPEIIISATYSFEGLTRIAPSK